MESTFRLTKNDWRPTRSNRGFAKRERHLAAGTCRGDLALCHAATSESGLGVDERRLAQNHRRPTGSDGRSAFALRQVTTALRQVKTCFRQVTKSSNLKTTHACQ